MVHGGWYVAIPVASFLIGSVMGFIRGGAKVRKLATSDPYMFDALWHEGALALEVWNGPNCVASRGDDYREFVARHFLHRQGREAPAPLSKKKVDIDIREDNDDGYVPLAGMPHVGEPVRVIQGRRIMLEGVIVEAWPESEGFTVEDEDGELFDFDLPDLQDMGMQVMSMPNVTAGPLNPREGSSS